MEKPQTVKEKIAKHQRHCFTFEKKENPKKERSKTVGEGIEKTLVGAFTDEERQIYN